MLLLVVLVAAFRSPAAAFGNWSQEERDSRLDTLLERTQVVDAALDRVQVVYSDEIEPLERVLRFYRDDSRLTRRIAASLVREGRRSGISPDILLAVLLVENPDLEPDARSFVGARGLMQVMPLHRGNWRACAEDMDSIEGNICYGAQIFKDNLRSTKGDVEKALLRYNGCVRGTNTPNCQNYPYHVFARAGRATILSRVANRATP